MKTVAKLPKDANVRIAYKTKNTVERALYIEPQKVKYSNRGIYQLQCNTCARKYIGQSERNLLMRYNNYLQDVKKNRGTTGFPRHILSLRHEYGNIEDTMRILEITKLSKDKKFREFSHTENNQSKHAA